MAKAEEKDLQILIQSLDKQTVKLFKNKLESSNQKDSIIKKTLFDAFYKTIQFDKNKFIKEHQINIRKFNSLKFDLFRDVINHLKNNYPKYSYTALQNEVMELVLLVNRGLYVKAIRKVHLIKQIAKSKYDYDTFCFVQRIVIDFKLYNHTNTFGNFSKACKDLKKYEKFSKNLSGHLLLNYKVLNIHNKFIDDRIDNRDILLKYLDHKLLKKKPKKYSAFSIYFYYLTKSLIYIGVNNHREAKKNSLKAYDCLIANSSKYRNDFIRCFKALNNYLNASLNLSETQPFEKYYPIMLKWLNQIKIEMLYQKLKSLNCCVVCD